MRERPVHLGIRRILSPQARAARRDESGFSVIEVILAMAIFAIVAAFLSQLLGVGFKGVLLGKRRELATSEANRLLEIARSLSYDAIGLIVSDPTIATDTENITDQAGVKSFRPDEDWEPIMWAPNENNHPFNPHIRDMVRGSTDLTSYLYVTGVDSDADNEIDLKRVTVRVEWSSAGTTGSVNEVRAQTLVSPESGVVCVEPCDSTADVNTPLTADTFASGGTLRVNSSLLGLTNPVTIALPTSKGSSESKLVSTATCTTQSASVRATDLIDLPGYAVTVTADNDAATATPSDPAPSTNNGVLTIPAGPVNSILGSSIGSPVSCDAAANPYPQEEGDASALSVLNAQTNVTALGGLLNWALTLAGVATMPVSQDIVNEVVNDQREAAASTANAIGTTQLLKIPGVIGSGLVQLDAFSYGASVRGAAGIPSSSPSITSPTFTIRVFDRNNALGATCGGAVATGITASRSGSYCVITINPATTGFTGRDITLSHNFTQLLGLNVVNLSYSTTISILPATKTDADGEEGPNGERRWSAEYTPIAISASLEADVLGIDIIDVDVDFNLGQVSARACAGATC